MYSLSEYKHSLIFGPNAVKISSWPTTENVKL